MLLTPTRMAKTTTKYYNNTNVGKNMEELKLSALLGTVSNGTTISRTVWQYLLMLIHTCPMTQ